MSIIEFSLMFLELAGILFEASNMYSSPVKSLTDIFYSEEEGQVNPDRVIVLIKRKIRLWAT